MLRSFVDVRPHEVLRLSLWTFFCVAQVWCAAWLSLRILQPGWMVACVGSDVETKSIRIACCTVLVLTVPCLEDLTTRINGAAEVRFQQLYDMLQFIRWLKREKMQRKERKRNWSQAMRHQRKQQSQRKEAKGVRRRRQFLTFLWPSGCVQKKTCNPISDRNIQNVTENPHVFTTI